MEITLPQYLLYGVTGVFIIATLLEHYMQYSFVNGKGIKDPTILFFSKTLSQEGSKYGPRILTMWNISHVLYFALGSYLFPTQRFELWLAGLVWEILEILKGASNSLDILWNSIGILIGYLLRR